MITTLPEQPVVTTDAEASEWGTGDTRITSWSVLDEVESRRYNTFATVSLDEPEVEGWGLYYYLDGRRVDLSFTGRRVNVTAAYDGEFGFDARGHVWVEGDTARHNVLLAGHGQRSSKREFIGTGRPIYEMPQLSGYLPQRFELVGIVKPPRRRQRAQPQSRADRACQDLCSWLGLTQAEVSDVVGVSRGTLNLWKHGGEPRQAKTARRLYQLRAAVRALRNRLGADGLHEWLGRGNPRPIDLLEQRNHDWFERLADEVIFPRDNAPRARLDAASPPESADQKARTPAPRKPKRSSTVRSRRLER
jgi:transcriptional regulator with XRE-family HTH domain